MYVFSSVLMCVGIVIPMDVHTVASPGDLSNRFTGSRVDGIMEPITKNTNIRGEVVAETASRRSKLYGCNSSGTNLHEDDKTVFADQKSTLLQGVSSNVSDADGSRPFGWTTRDREGTADNATVNRILPNQDKTISNQKFIRIGDDWYARASFGLDRVVEIGYEGKPNPYIFSIGCASGKYHTFNSQRTTPHLLDYVSKLPVRYSRKAYICDGTTWYIDIGKGRSPIIHWGNVSNLGILQAFTESGLWYKIPDRPELAQLRDYISSLPRGTVQCIDYDNYRLKRTGETRYQHYRLVNRKGELGEFTTFGHTVVYARTSKKWYRFINPPRRLLMYLTKLPWMYHRSEFKIDEERLPKSGFTLPS